MRKSYSIILLSGLLGTHAWSAVWVCGDSAAFVQGAAESTAVTAAGVGMMTHPVKYAADARLNDDATSTDQENPAMAMAADGRYTVVWEDGRAGNWDVYLQRFNADGSDAGTDLAVNDDTSGAEQRDPAVGISDSACIAVWADDRDGNFDIYYQFFDRDGAAVGSNIMVNADAGSADQARPAVWMDTTGRSLVVWADNRNGDYDIIGQYVSPAGSLSGTNFVISDGSGDQDHPAVWTDASGYALAVWEDFRSGVDWDIRARAFLDGIPVDSSYLLSDDATGFNQRYPAFDVRDGLFVAVWEDGRDGPVRIYGQRGSAVSGLTGGNFAIDDDTGPADKKFPDVAVLSGGAFVTAWQDLRNESTGGFQIWGQHMAPGAVPVRSNFRIDDNNESGGKWATMTVVLAGAADGTLPVIWMDKRSGNRDIYQALFQSETGLASGIYTSPVHNTGYEFAEYQTIGWVRGGDDSLRFQVRTAPDSLSITDTLFTGPDGTVNSWYTVSGESLAAGLNGNRYVQYRTDFLPVDSSFTPVLESVTVSWGGIVPVTWGGISAVQEGSRVTLAWQTVSEINTMGFHVFGAAGSAGSFRMLSTGMIPGHGTTVVPHEYVLSFIPVPGPWLFYVRETAFDGSVSNSDTIAVTVADAGMAGIDGAGFAGPPAISAGIRRYTLDGRRVRGDAGIPAGIMFKTGNDANAVPETELLLH